MVFDSSSWIGLEHTAQLQCTWPPWQAHFMSLVGTQEACRLTPGCSSVCAKKFAPRLVSLRLKVQPYTPPPCLYRVPVTISQFVCSTENQRKSTAAAGKHKLLLSTSWLIDKTLAKSSDKKQPAWLSTLPHLVKSVTGWMFKQNCLPVAAS